MQMQDKDKCRSVMRKKKDINVKKVEVLISQQI